MRDKAVKLHQEIDANHLSFISCTWIKFIQVDKQNRLCLKTRPEKIDIYIRQNSTNKICLAQI